MGLLLPTNFPEEPKLKAVDIENIKLPKSYACDFGSFIFMFIFRQSSLKAKKIQKNSPNNRAISD
jgi:hypothetical protein